LKEQIAFDLLADQPSENVRRNMDYSNIFRSKHVGTTGRKDKEMTNAATQD
jgi:hypothetical protein